MYGNCSAWPKSTLKFLQSKSKPNTITKASRLVVTNFNKKILKYFLRRIYLCFSSLSLSFQTVWLSGHRATPHLSSSLSVSSNSSSREANTAASMSSFSLKMKDLIREAFKKHWSNWESFPSSKTPLRRSLEFGVGWWFSYILTYFIIHTCHMLLSSFLSSPGIPLQDWQSCPPGLSVF